MAVNKPWWASLESTLFTKYKTRLRQSCSEKFPQLYCTASPMTTAASKFPTAYAILGTIQVDVITNTSLDDCKEVIYETINIMKAMRFDMIGMPIYSAQNNLYTGVVRFRRYIGSGDTI